MLKGTLDDFNLADIFKLMSFSKKTGRLELIRKAGMGRIFFRDGEVYYAESSLSREPLGQKLIRARALTDSSLRKALDEHAETGERVGQILLREGSIDEAQLEAGVKQQIEDAVFDLLRWELGDFEWEPGATLEPEVPISVSVENLIMESSRRLDELEVISRKVPSSQAILAVTPAPPEGAVEINITPDEWRVLVLVDGHRSVETIANTIGLDEFQTMRIVHGMVSAGLIEVAGVESDTKVATAPPPPLEAVVPPPPPPPVLENEGQPVAEEEAPEAEESSLVEEPFHPVGEEPFSVDAIETEFVEEPQSAEVESLQDEEQVHEHVSDLPDSFVSAFEDALGDVPDDEDVVEETLFEANGSSNGLAADAASPPEEWFTDPDLSMELFDAPSSGDLMTEVPEEAENAVEEDELQAAVEAPEATPEATVDEEILDPQPNLISDDTLVEMPSAPDAPPPPPIAPVEGQERHAAVRELAGLFEDAPVERPRPPVIRRIEPTSPEAARKRRVEDDEQVTKGLISRLIEGVKGL